MRRLARGAVEVGADATNTSPVPKRDLRARAVLAFYAYRILSRCYFHLLILLIWLLEARGLSIMTSAALLALYGASLTYGAPVTARLQWRVPAAASIVAGELTKAAGLVALVASDNVLVLGVGQVLSGVGYSLAQGPDSVLLRSMFDDGEVAKYRTHESRSMSWVFVAVLVAGAIGGFLYQEDADLPFVVSVAATLLAAGAAWSLGRTATAARPAGPPHEPARVITVTLEEHRWILYYATMRGLSLAAFVALLPVLFFYELEVEVRLFGAVLGSFSVFAYASGRYGVQVLNRFREDLVPAGSVLVLGIALVLLSAAHALPLALTGMALLGTVSGTVRPLATGRLNSVVERRTSERGAVLARMERLYGITNALAIVAGAFVTDRWGIRSALLLLAVCAVLLGAVAPMAARRLTGSLVRS